MQKALSDPNIQLSITTLETLPDPDVRDKGDRDGIRYICTQICVCINYIS